MLKPSGSGVSKVFTREFIDPTLPRDHLFTNLWLQTSKLSEAKVKYSTVPDSKLYGMIWSPKGYGLRVLQQDAAQIAPVFGRQICGIRSST